MLDVTRPQARAYRIARQYLDRRLPLGEMLTTAIGGIQDTPPGSALLSLAARVEEMTSAELDATPAMDKSLLQVWSMRGAPCLIPAGDEVPAEDQRCRGRPEQPDTKRALGRAADHRPAR